MRLSSLAKNLFMGKAGKLPRWVCCGHESPQTQVTIRLNAIGKDKRETGPLDGLDVTQNHIIVELRPQKIGIMLHRAGLDGIKKRPDGWCLSLHDPGHIKKPDYQFGEVGLKYREYIDLDEYVFVIFETTYCRNDCLPAARLQGHYLYERIKLFFDRDPHNIHKMKPRYLFSNWLLFSLPRAVALVSFDDGNCSNMFPMDLIGTTDSPYYVLSLTSSYPGVSTIARHKRLAVSHVSLDQIEKVYAMAKNHKKNCVPRGEMLVSTVLSELFSIPVPETALSVRELEIVATYEVEYHNIFVAVTRNFVRHGKGLHMCHVQRIYQQYLLNQNRGLPYQVRQYKRPGSDA